MGRRPLRKRLSLKSSQKTIPHYFKKRQEPNKRFKKRFRVKRKYQKVQKDDESYILPSITDETDDFTNLDLDDETIDSQFKSTSTKSNIKEKKIKTRGRKRKAYKPVNKKTKRFKRKRGRPRKYNKDINEEIIPVEKNENVNSFEELNFCYNELNDLLSVYPFSDVADAILKINNGIEKDDSDKNEKILFKKIGHVNSVIKNKQDINTMCLSILASKIMNNELVKDNNNNINCDNIPIEIPEGENPKEIIINQEKPKEENQKEEKPKIRRKSLNKDKYERKVINGFKSLNQRNYKFGMHFFNSGNNCIFQYDPTVSERRTNITLFCRKRTVYGCKAKCTVYSCSNDVTLGGKHNHAGIPYKLFYDAYPQLKNEDWEHVQIIKDKEEDIIVKQC